MFSTCLLLLLLAANSCVHSIELTQSGSTVVTPGQSVTLTCRVSGYSLTDTSYCTHWIRQPAGKALEWVGCSCGTGSTYYSYKLKSRYQVTRDTSSSTVSLRGQNLQTEDTAVYYCARYNYAFDYWGKGTMVTVSSGGQTKPSSLFAVSSCGPSDGFFTLGCISSGFSPADSHTFSWTGDVTDKVDYPAVQANGAFTAVSHVRVKDSDWKAKKSFKCKASNPAGFLEKGIDYIQSVPKPATLLLTTPTNAELDNGTATFICIASQFSPKTFKFIWMLGETELSEKNRTQIETEEKSTKTYTAISILEITASEWRDRVLPVKCVFQHEPQTQTREAKYEAPPVDDIKVEMIPPSNEDMLIRGAGDLQCKATGPKGFTSIRWLCNGKELASTEETGPQGDYMLAKTKINYNEWSKGTTYICEVGHTNFAAETNTYSYKREDGGDSRCPSVYLLPPPEISPDSVTLTCYVKHFYPKEVVVYWLANDEKLNNTEQYQQRTTSLIEIEKNLYSVYSQLVMDRMDWENGVTFSCLVYHEAIDPTVRLIARSIDNASNKPTLVSLSMNVPSISTCGN